MGDYIRKIKTINNNINFIKQIKFIIESKFRIVSNNKVTFFIYLNTFNNFKENISDYKTLFNNFLSINKKIKTLFILTYNIEQFIELYDNFTIIITNKNPEIYMNDFKKNILNLEGLRYIAKKLNIVLVKDNRIQNDIKNLPYTKIVDLNNEYQIYEKEFKEYNDELIKNEKYLLNENKRVYFFYFKLNIKRINFIEKNPNYFVIFYPHYKKKNLLSFFENNLKDKT